MLLLHPYNPRVRPEAQIWTWEALGHLASLPTVTVRHYRVGDDTGYAEILVQAWRLARDWYVVEQDIVPTWRRLIDLEHCERPFCAFDYPVESGVLWSSLEGGLGLGLAKLTLAARRSVVPTPAVPRVHWREVAGALRDRLPPVHVHPGPVDHRHGYP